MRQKPKILLSIILVTSLLMSMVACNGSSPAATNSAGNAAPTITSAQSSSPSPSPTVPATKVYTDMTGRQVELPTNIKSIVCVRYMELNLLSAILGDDFENKVISLGMSVEENDCDNYNKFSEIYDLSKLQTIGSIYDDDISVETMLELNPDIIISDVYFKDKECVKKMIEAGLPIFFLDFNSLYGPLDSTQLLGQILGVEEHTDAMVTYARDKIDSVIDRVNALLADGAKRPTLYFECGNTIPSELGATRADTTDGWGNLWYILGADNIGVGHDFEELDPEIVLTDDPDVIVIGGSNWDKTSDIMRLGYYVTDEQASDHLGEYVNQRSGWKDLKAIKSKRLYCVHFNSTIYPFRFSIIESMAQMLWPEELSDLDPQVDLEEFFKLYMPVEYSGEFAAQWSGQ
jgi:iron complex transport system substrate-binding protein